MSEPGDFDIFARRSHADVLSARMRRMSTGDLGSVVLRASEVVMGMPEDDRRRVYAQEYLGIMLDGLDELPEHRDAQLGFLYVTASFMMADKYGTTSFFPGAPDVAGTTDPQQAFWSDEGMYAADAVLTHEIIGPPAPEQPQQ